MFLKTKILNTLTIDNYKKEYFYIFTIEFKTNYIKVFAE